uniref:BTB domain-containing protein n=1 Tax=Ditylenchus dipsaci TaxID=166011 RepID=A0A915DIR7_9BILA
MPRPDTAKKSLNSNGRPTPYAIRSNFTPEVIDIEEEDIAECLKRLENQIEKSMKTVDNSIRSFEHLLLSNTAMRSNENALDKDQFWYLVAKKVEQDEEEYLSVFLRCRALIQTIKYKTSYSIDLIGSKEHFCGSSPARCFNEQKQSWGWHTFIAWSKFSDYGSGFLDNKGNAILLAKFSTTATTLLGHANVTKFSESAPYKSDCVLIVGNHRLEVHKGFLSMYSPYFAKLFGGVFSRHNQVEISNVSAVEMIALLEVIYPPFAEDKINDTNVECLLCMAKKFDVVDVTAKCEAYLLKYTSNKISFAKRMLLAHDYQLNRLREVCIDHFTSKDEIKNLKQSKDYMMLSDRTKTLIYESFIDTI